MSAINKIQLSFFVLSLVCGQSWAANYAVNPDGTGNYTTIQACANSARAGDTCSVHAGQYNEHVVTKADGAAGAYITFQAAGTVTMQGFELRNAYIEVNGFDITGTPAMNIAHILVMAAAGNARIINNTIRDGADNVYGISWYSLSGQTPAGNCVISGNTLRNLAGQALVMDGANHVVDHNTFETLNGWDNLRLFGHDDLFSYNTFKESAYSETIAHGNHADWLQTWGTSEISATNMTFDHNFIQNLTGGYQLGQIEACEPGWLDSMASAGTPVANCDALNFVHDFIFTNNVFYNVSNTMNIDAPTFKFTNNTFYLNAYNSSAVLGFSPLGWPKGSGNNGVSQNNVFVDNGPDPDTYGQWGWYNDGGSVPGYSAAHLTADYNFVTGPAAAGFPPKAGFAGKEPHGLNGGDPKFQNIDNPLGPDGRPFTDDDGLIPMAGSPLCGQGLNGGDRGAYACSNNAPPLTSADCSRAEIKCVDQTAGPTQEYATIQACANGAHAGDTCLVFPGNYSEHVETAAGGAAGNFLTFQAAFSASNSGTAPNQLSTTKGFRIKHPYVKVNGFDITKYDVGLDAAHVTVEPEGQYAQILDNVIRDGIYLTSANFAFDAVAHTITNPAGGFIAAGFKPGVTIYIGCNINKIGQYLNHDTIKSVTGVSDTVLTVQDISNPNISNWQMSSQNPVSATIYVNRAEKMGVGAVTFVSATGRGTPNNCLIQNNTFSNLAGRAVEINGNNNTITRNIWVRMNGWRMFSFFGNNNVFSHNVFKDSPRWPDFDMPLPGTVFAAGSGTWDMYDTLMTSFGMPDQTVNNNVFEFNFIKDIDEQLASVEDSGGFTGVLPTTGLVIRNNVFVGVEMIGSFTRPDTEITHNTFFRSAWQALQTQNVVVAKSLHGNPVGSFIKNNAFIGCGEQPDANHMRGWYSLIADDGLPSPQVSADYNFVAGSAADNYSAKVGFQANGVESHGVNGGNPMFKNSLNVWGPDGLPFTSDDGLMPLAGSPLCGAGEGGSDLGAYACPGATRTLTVSVSGSGSVTSNPPGINCGATCSMSVPSGTSVTLTAYPVSGYGVVWTGCSSSSGNSCTVILDMNTAVSAAFNPTPTSVSGETKFNSFKTVFNPIKESALGIKFDLGQNPLSLVVYDRRGNKIKTLHDGHHATGPVNDVTWDGRNEKGEIVASGVYILQLKTGDKKLTKKIVVVK